MMIINCVRGLIFVTSTFHLYSIISILSGINVCHLKLKYCIVIL